MNILITSSDSIDYTSITESVTKIITESGHSAINWDEQGVYNFGFSLVENLDIIHKNADILIVFAHQATFGVYVELGHALAKKIPIILICTLDDLRGLHPEHLSDRFIIYDVNRPEESLLNPLRNMLAIKNVEQFVKDSKEQEKLNVFVSYSHKDTEYLDRLKIHIKPLEKKGLIDFWSDTKIQVGDKWRDSIVHALNKAAVAILLISADFLASDFIVDNELPPLLKKAEENGLTIIPVILKPCRFAKDENLSVFHAINPPSLPISKMTENDQEETYVNIVDSIDSILNLVK